MLVSARGSRGPSRPRGHLLWMQRSLVSSVARDGRAYFAPALVSSSSCRRHPATPAPCIHRRTPLRHLHFSPPSRHLPPPAQGDSRQAPASSSSSDGGEASLSKLKPTFVQRAWTAVKSEASHYWHGTKLLGKEIRLSAKYQMKLLRGKKLTRRERRQLKRTTQDLLRLIPFSVFLIVPFMELLLPIALRLFPNMLPSTFRDESKELEKKRKLLKVRLEMAKFLQETLRESGVRSPQSIKESEEFKEFFRKVRATGEAPSTDDIVRVAKLFEDDLTLDNLSRPQLVSMCRYMNINAFGTDNFLRYTIRSRMASLARDDALIDAEGLNSLSPSELRHACQSRGIRSMGVDEVNLMKELGQWIDLHLHRGLSPTLLILGRAFAYTRGGEKEAGDSTLESLKDALSSLPDTLLNETELEVSFDSVTNKQRLAVLQEQEELIADESEQEEKEEEARKAAKEAEREREVREKAEAALPEGVMAAEANTAATEAKEGVKEEAKKVEEKDVDPKDVRMTSEQLSELGEALSVLSAKSSVLQERQDLQKLMEENAGAAAEQTEGASASLVKRIQKMVQQIDAQLKAYDDEVGERMHTIDIGADGKICVADIKKALTVIAHAPSKEAVNILVDKLDTDHDGFVLLEHVLSLVQEEGLGIVIEDSQWGKILGEGRRIRADGRSVVGKVAEQEEKPSPPKDEKPKKSDIVED